jgi:hypothetical protein
MMHNGGLFDEYREIWIERGQDRRLVPVAEVARYSLPPAAASPRWR